MGLPFVWLVLLGCVRATSENYTSQRKTCRRLPPETALGRAVTSTSNSTLNRSPNCMPPCTLPSISQECTRTGTPKQHPQSINLAKTPHRHQRLKQHPKQHPKTPPAPAPHAPALSPACLPAPSCQSHQHLKQQAPQTAPSPALQTAHILAPISQITSPSLLEVRTPCSL